MTPMEKTVVGNIKKLLKSSDLKQYQLAIAVGLDPAQLSDRMTGAAPFELGVLFDIVKVLDVDPLDLFEGAR